jgi:hypothetical protein
MTRDRASDDDLDRGSEPPAPGSEERPSQLPPGGESRRKRFEHMLPELIKRGIEKGFEAGLGTLSRTDEALRGVVAEGKLPREVASHVFAAIDDTKNGMLRVVGREVRDFLQATDLSKELQKALTSLSFEIKTEIRFIPNDAGTGVKPEIKAGSTSVKRRSAPPPAPEGDDADAEAPEPASAVSDEGVERPSLLPHRRARARRSES